MMNTWRCHRVKKYLKALWLRYDVCTGLAGPTHGDLTNDTSQEQTARLALINLVVASSPSHSQLFCVCATCRSGLGRRLLMCSSHLGVGIDYIAQFMDCFPEDIPHTYYNHLHITLSHAHTCTHIHTCVHTYTHTHTVVT